MVHVVLLVAAVVAVWTVLALPLGVLVGRRLRRVADRDGQPRSGTAEAPVPQARTPADPGTPPVGRGPVRRRAAGRTRGV